VKIDKNKLNTLLRSGLNPDIKTRKQLAAQLGLDPTSLTRWFANRDRLGNPRYPVVPDRHVTKILALFNLSPQSLSLSEEEFRHHCFELSIQNKKGQNDKRQKNVAERELSIEEYSAPNKRTLSPALFIGLFVFAMVCYVVSEQTNLFVKDEFSKIEQDVTKTKCWSGFSSSLGDFEKEDKADPCHYNKLFHRAMGELKEKNNNQTQATSLKEYTASQNYLLFLSKQLDQRRLNDNVSLNVELGKTELRQLNYLAAQNYFEISRKLLTSSAKPDTKTLKKINSLIAQTKAALK